MAAPRRGSFVTIEGGDGTGKSTLARALAERLKAEGRSVQLASEPGGTPLGTHVKRFFEDCAAGRAGPVTPSAELFLFEAARAQNVAEVLRPALARGDIVLCDRYTDSTIAYQGYGRGLDLAGIERCNALATGGLAPELTLLLDLPSEEALRRAQSDSNPSRTADSLGSETLAFHARVRDGFLAISKREPHRVAVIDAGRPPEEVLAAAWERVREAVHV